MSETGGLKPGFTLLGIWAFSIGTSIGWGSFIVTCNTYLQKSGLLGTVFGLLFAAGRDGEAPGRFAQVNEKGIPHKAILAVAGVSILIPFLGRTAIGWIVDVTTLGATIIYALVSHAVWQHAKQNNQKTEKATGMAGMVLMVLFLLLLLVPGLLPFHAMETES